MRLARGEGITAFNQAEKGLTIPVCPFNYVRNKYGRRKGDEGVAIFALSDLHLSFGTDKPMDVFGGRWENYTERICENWQRTVSNDDLVIIAGDVSWATYIEDAVADFRFINNLNGKKVIIKGNHDYWWTTLSKMERFLSENGFDTIQILNNTAAVFEDTAICGTRGWGFADGESRAHNEMMFERERMRLVRSLEQAERLHPKRRIVAMHYPPADKNGVDRGFTEIMKNYGVDCCVYGHLHSYAHKNAVEGIVDGVELKLTSCDFVNFTPVLLW